MTDIEFEYADYCINKLNSSYPGPADIDWFDKKSHRHDERLSNKEQEKIRAILIEENWIEIYHRSEMYILQKCALTILDKYKSYSNYYWYDEGLKNKKEQKDKFEFHVSKWKYYTFWWFFGLAIFGGGYSAYDFIERLSKPKSSQQGQIPKVETESVESKSHTLTLDQKNLDSLHISRTQADSLNIK